MKPNCFTEKEWCEYQKDWGITQLSKADTYCTDCTPARKTKMLLQKRCDWPCVVFVSDSCGGTIGKRLSRRCVYQGTVIKEAA